MLKAIHEKVNSICKSRFADRWFEPWQGHIQRGFATGQPVLDPKFLSQIIKLI